MSNKSNPAVVRPNSALQFLEAFIREPLTVGSLGPSWAELEGVVEEEVGDGWGAEVQVLLGNGERDRGGVSGVWRAVG